MEIRQEYQAEITRLADFLQQHQDLKLTIEGHTDNIGSDRYNQQLSEARAKAMPSAWWSMEWSLSD